MASRLLVLRYVGRAVRSPSLPYIEPEPEDLETLAPGREFEIPAEGIVVGRSGAADVRVYSPYVKGAHVRLWPVDGGIAVEDLQSTNGTAINGVIFSDNLERRQTVLRAGDRLTLAGTHDFEIA